MRRLPDDIGLASVTEYGVTFRTGASVTFRFMRNTEGAPKLPRHIQPQFGQDIEPAGRYMLHAPPSFDPFATWIGGEITFRNPIVLEHRGTSSDPGGWKRRLSDAFGGKKKRALTNALRRAGYDGIVTIEGNHTSEIVDLTTMGRQARSPMPTPTLRSRLIRLASTLDGQDRKAVLDLLARRTFDKMPAEAYDEGWEAGHAHHLHQPGDLHPPDYWSNQAQQAWWRGFDDAEESRPARFARADGPTPEQAASKIKAALDPLFGDQDWQVQLQFDSTTRGQQISLSLTRTGLELHSMNGATLKSYVPPAFVVLTLAN